MKLFSKGRFCKSNFSETRFSDGFSIIELVFVVVIAGILLSIALPKFGSSESSCINEIRGRLLSKQSEISNFYRESFLLGSTPPPELIQAKILELDMDLKNCSLNVNIAKSSITAKVSSSSVVFSITPKGYEVAPKINCTLSNRLCQRLLDRSLSK